MRMKSRWKIARVAGIDIYLHATFPLLVVWIAIYRYSQSGTLGSAGTAAAFILLLFAAIALHELGHAVVARRFGIRTQDITLLPIGGIARMERMPEKPREEMLVAVAGPVVNMVLAALLVGLAAIWPVRPAPAFFLEELARANYWLAAFNLLPVFPLDGGRILRAALSLEYGHLRATEIATLVGRTGALLIGFAGLIWNPLLVVIAFFVWISAAAESETTRLQELVADVRVEQVMLRDCQTFVAGETLARAANHLLASSQEDFPVITEDRRLLGVLRRTDLIQGVAERGPDARVEEIMQRRPRTASLHESVRHLLHRWNPPVGAVAVLEHGHKLVGLLTATNLGEFLLVQSALHQHAEPASHPALTPPA